MADDIFGDESLFSEFEKDREATNIFIQYDQDESGVVNRSRIIFRDDDSESDSSEDESGTDSDKTKNICTELNEPTEIGKASLIESKSAISNRSSKDEDRLVEIKTQEENGNHINVDSTWLKEEITNELGKDARLQVQTHYQDLHQRKTLQRFANLIDSTRFVSDEQSPGVQVLFSNNKFARKYRTRIEQFIIGLTDHADSKDFSKPSSDLSLRVRVSSCVEINNKLPPEKRNNRMWQAHGIIGSAQFHQNFMIDSKGWPLDSEDPSHCSNWEIPKYPQQYDEVLSPERETESNTVIPKPAKPKDSCFNCGGEHRLGDCKEIRDEKRIRNNRREYQEKAGSSRNQSHSSRYHLDPELNPKKNKCKAGTISEELRKAMGLRPDQLPSYIYRMRLHGYPPGWLMEANRGSALSMYDKDGKETSLRGENTEEGEVQEQTPEIPAAYDLQKIIEYPGFTVPVPLGFIDESANMGLPPIQQHQLKKTLIEDVTSKELAKKRQLEVEETVSKRVKHEDMDLEEEDETLPQTLETSLSSKNIEDAKTKKESTSRGSPTMDTLQQKYHELLEELESENITVNEMPMPSSTSSATADTQPLLDAGLDSSSNSSTLDSASTSAADILRQKNFSFTSTTSISKEYGTPIHIKDKSFRALPSPEKFHKGIEDHIPFENLPDSVGTFERMRNLFKSIKEKVSRKKK